MTEPVKKQLTLDEEADEIIRRLKAPPAPIYRNTIIIPLIRKILPGLIANEIIGVQPMSSSIGKIFTMKTTYDGNRNNQTEN